jgi:hypothetical protein
MVSDFQKRIMDENWGAQATSLRILYHTDKALFGALKPLTELRWRTNCQKFRPPGRVIFCDRTSVLWFRFLQCIMFAIELHGSLSANSERST